MKNLIGYFTQHVIIRFIIAGGTSAAIDLALLYLLNSVFGMYYLTSAILAFLVAFCISFVLHKFWTFKSHKEETHRQVVLYFAASLFSLLLNTFLMYIFVDHVHVQVILAQIFTGAIVAFSNFFVSRRFVFKYVSQKP